MSPAVDALVAHFQFVHRERMAGLPFVNDKLAVEAVGFDAFEAHELGVLITPWFINLVLLPGDDSFATLEQGATERIELPAGAYDFVAGYDERLGRFLSAILFRTVADFPDQATARAVAEEILLMLRAPADNSDAPKPAGKPISRRELFTQLGAS